MEQVKIITGDLLVRGWQADDIDAVYRACQDPDIQRFTRVPSPYRREHAVDFVNSQAPEVWDKGLAAPLGVFDLNTGDLLGANGLISRDPTGLTAEVGYWTAPWARGRGVALAATRAVATWAFDWLGIRHLRWRAEVGNWASRTVASRAGFQMHGEDRMADPQRPRGRFCWAGTLLPGEVTNTDPVRYAAGSRYARRAKLFGGEQPELPTDLAGVRLRPLQVGDTELVTAGCQDNETARWTTVPVPYQRRDAEYFITDHAALTWSRGSSAIYAIADPDDNWAGSIHVSIDQADERAGEIGYLIGPWARGRGYATAAVRTLAAWSFDALDLYRLNWRAHLGNTVSRRVAERAGFTIEGVQRAGCVQRGERRDAWVGSRLATDP